MTPFELTQLIHCREHFEGLLSDSSGIRELTNVHGVPYFARNFGLFRITDFFQKIPKSTFLTVGDGYAACEGVFIKQFGHYVHACDQAPQLIALSWSQGLIDYYSTEDFNHLSFRDNVFDFVFTKETLHHLSHTYQGIYEMLRVCHKGAILIEPNGDGHFDHGEERTGEYGGWEDIRGWKNFCFTFRAHELIKIGLAYGIRHFVYTYTSGYNKEVEAIVQGEGTDAEKTMGLISLDKGKIAPLSKDMIVFFFLKDKAVFELLNEGYWKVEVQS